MSPDSTCTALDEEDLKLKGKEQERDSRAHGGSVSGEELGGKVERGVCE